MNKGNPVFISGESAVLENNLRFVKNELEEELNHIFNPVVEQAENIATRKSKIIKPLPGFCIKTHKENNGEKVFINLCHSDSMPSPLNITEEKLIEILENGTPSEYKIPMSITNPRPTKDKSDQDCLVIDVAISTTFFQKIESCPTFRDFLMAVLMEGIDTKYGVTIDINSWIIMKNRKFVDQLVSHNIQNRDVKEAIDYHGNGSSENSELLTLIENSNKPQKKKLIEELSETPAIETKKENDSKKKPYTPNPIKMAISQANTKKPDSRLFVYPAADKPAKTLIAEFYLPLIESAKEINLDVGEDRIIVEARKNGYLFDGFVDYKIDQDNVKVNFNTFNHKLRVKMPLKG